MNAPLHQHGTTPSPTAAQLRVAVVPAKFGYGVEAPGTVKKIRGVDGPHTYDWRAHGEANTARVTDNFVVQPLVEALERRYRTDAHMVSYYVLDPNGRPLERQPRINKGGLAWVLGQGYRVEHDLLYVDVDNPQHLEWTDALRARFDELWAHSPVLKTTGVYLTRSGYRLLQPLDEPVHAGEDAVERYLAAWIDELADHGITADHSCIDWTRLMRLPHVRRGPVNYTSPLVDMSRLEPRSLTPKAPAGLSSRCAGLERLAA